MVQRLKYNKILFFVILTTGIGLLGTIFFFPVNLGKTHTCLYHRIFCPEENAQYSGRPDSTMSHSKRPQASETVKVKQEHEGLLDFYVIPFGFLWWGSLGILALGILSWKKQQK